MEASDQRGTTLPHARAIEKNFDLLMRCTDVNVYVISCLRAENVLSFTQELQLNGKKCPYERMSLLYNWVKKSQDVAKYEKFLQVMEQKEVGQQHVANLLRGFIQGNQSPLSETRYTRLVKIRPKLVEALSGLEVDTELLNLVKASLAISNSDYDEIAAKTSNSRKSYCLVNAIMRRSNEAFDLFKQALVETKRHHMAAYLDEGEMPKLHINTSRPDLDGDLSEAFNQAVIDRSKSKLLSQLNGINLHPVVARPGHSIEVLIYCREMQDVEIFVQTLNSKKLEEIICSILNELLLKIEPENTDGLNAKIGIDEEEAVALEEIAAIDYYLERTAPRAKVVNNVAVQCGPNDFPEITCEKATTSKIDLVKAFARLIEAVTESMEKLRFLDRSSTGTKQVIINRLEKLKAKLLRCKEAEKDMKLLVRRIESTATGITKFKRSLDELDESTLMPSHKRHKRSDSPTITLSPEDYEVLYPTLEEALLLYQSVVEMTILKDEMHVVYKCSSLISTFDCSTYKFKGQAFFKEISNPKSITSCSLNECVYIMNYSESQLLMEILKFDSALTKLVTRWEIPVDSCQPSVYNGNIVIPYVDGPSASIAEYNSDGTRICEIKVRETVHAHSLWRAAKIGGNLYVGLADCMLALVLIDDTGKIKEKKRLEQYEQLHSTCSATEGSRPKLKYLKMESEGNVLLAVGNTIFLISPDFKTEQRLVIERGWQNNGPTNICFVESNESLYVVDKDTGFLQIYTINGSNDILLRSSVKMMHRKLQKPRESRKETFKSTSESIEEKV